MDKSKITDELIAQMTLEEKVNMVGGKGFMGMPECKRLGLMSAECADGPLGLRIEKEWDKNCTAFPCGGSMASTWNQELIEQVGEAIANDCIKYDKAMILGPGVNLKRTPLCGRNFEYFSEDPVLAGKIAAAYIRGVERQGVGTCIKHLVANNQELYRGTASADIDERTLRDMYLKVFQIAIEESNPAAMMLAYNRVNGICNIESEYLMRDVVRNDWGYDGILMSDWYATRNPVISLKNGLNLQMPYEDDRYEKISRALGDGSITEQMIDEAIRPTIKFLYDRQLKKLEYDRNIQHMIAHNAAAEGIVLLKNENDVLPITPEKYNKITVVGGFAKTPVYYGYGSARVYTENTSVDVPVEEIKKILDGKVEVSYVEGYSSSISSQSTIFDWRPDFAPGHGGKDIEEADLVILFLGQPFGTETEDTDLDTAYLFHYYTSYIQRVQNLNKNIVIVLQSGVTVIPQAWNYQVPAVVQMWMAGEAGGGAIADILCGKVTPSGKLSETIAKKPRTDLDYPGNGFTIRYDEKWAIGYRYYDNHPEEVAYPFGFGLSYTTFAYSDFAVDCIGEQLRFVFTVKNTGNVSGKEIVQLYVSKPESYIARPKKELIDFCKTEILAPGESQSFELVIPMKRLGYFNINLHKSMIESGCYEFLLGASSTDIRSKTSYTHQETGEFSMNSDSYTAVG